MKKSISIFSFIILVTFSFVTLVSAQAKYEIKEIPEISKYNPEWFWLPENGKMTFYGAYYDCREAFGCNMYSYDFKGNVTKLNEWGGFGSASGPYDALSIKEKDGEDYIVQTCYYNAHGEKQSCKTLENLKIRKLIKTNLELNILEIQDKDSKTTKYVIYDGSGKEILKLSSNLELVIPYEKDNYAEFGEGEYIISYNSYPGDDNIIIFKNIITNNYHVIGNNVKEEIITLDVLKEYGLNTDSVLNLQISLSDDKNIYHVNNKIFGDSKRLFSEKSYVDGRVAKLGNEYIIIDHVPSDESDFKDSYYNNWYYYDNVYDINGTALVNENEYLLVNEEVIFGGLLIMHNKQGEVIVRDNKSIILEKDTGLSEVVNTYSSIVYQGNVYFVLTTPDEYGNADKGYAYVLEITDTKEEPATKEYTYEFLTGIKVTFKIDSKSHVTFTIDGDFKLFKEIYIDGKLLDAKYYTVKEGSTIISLNDDYARKLIDKKEHTIKAIYTNGKEVSTTFKVEENVENPHTGQAISFIFIASLIGLAAFVKSKNKSDVLKKI